jgi:UrcA family protein
LDGTSGSEHEAAVASVAATGGKDMMKFSLMAILLLAGAPAIAHAGQAAPTVRVRTADLDLTTAKGRKTLDRRLAIAVEQVCREQSNFSSSYWTPNARCRAAAAKQVRPLRTQTLAAASVRAGTNMMALR